VSLPPGIDGRWIGTAGGRLLQVRIDLALGMLSGDLYEGDGPDEDPDDGSGRWRYEGSFLSSVLTSRWIAGRAVELSAPLSFLSRGDRYGQIVVRIWVPQPGRPETAAEARLTIASHRRPSDTIALRAPITRRSSLLRSARLYVDTTIDQRTRAPYVVPPHHVIGSAPPFPADLRRRDLSIAGAFADAGIELSVVPGAKPIALPSSAYTHGLTDDELHGILTSVTKDEPPRAWWVHLLVAPRHAMRGVLGMVYDTERMHPRHGTVIFHDELKRAVAVDRQTDVANVGDDHPHFTRDFLYTAVHELGHAFNLLHSFQKGWFGGSDVAPRPDAASWMNYPHLYPHGAWLEADQPDRFWADFRFQFDRAELEHLRHHERDEVMMGAHAFGALGDRVIPDAIGCAGGLSASVEVRAAYEHGEPFPVVIQLENRGGRALVLDLPRDPWSAVELTVRTPGGRYRRIEPLTVRRETPGAWRRVVLRGGESERLRLGAFYGRHGFTFEEPGTYCLHARLTLPGRAPLALGATSLYVKSGGRTLERLLADRLFGDEQGHFLTFLGGDHLTRGKGSLEELVADPRFAVTRAAVPVRTALAASYARSSQGPAQVRAPKPAEALRMLGDLVPRDLLERQKAAGPGLALRVLLDTLRVLDVPSELLGRIGPEVVGTFRAAAGTATS
jgi:hypothetical protein